MMQRINLVHWHWNTSLTTSKHFSAWARYCCAFFQALCFSVNLNILFIPYFFFFCFLFLFSSKVLACQDEYEEAILMLRKALKLEPGNKVPYNGEIAFLYYGQQMVLQGKISNDFRCRARSGRTLINHFRGSAFMLLP